jgi:hypothetical protein
MDINPARSRDDSDDNANVKQHTAAQVGREFPSGSKALKADKKLCRHAKPAVRGKPNVMRIDLVVECVEDSM